LQRGRSDAQARITKLRERGGVAQPIGELGPKRGGPIERGDGKLHQIAAGHSLSAGDHDER
jgi:hypothetical protein